MTNIILLILFGNFIIALIYTLALRKVRKNNILTIFLIVVLIPVYGFIILGIFDMIKNESSCTMEKFFKESAKVKEQVADECTFTIEEMLCSMPIDDILMMKDEMHRRGLLFKAVSGDCLILYPLLKKMLNDKDPEVVHYASAAITNYTREIYDNFRTSKESHLSNTSNNIDQLKYIDSLIKVIIWEELDGRDMSEDRRVLEKELEILFKSVEAIDEKYYIEKYRNEAKLKEFDVALITCIRYLIDFPESEASLLSMLELGYCSKDPKRFAEALEDFKYINKVLSSDTKKILSFWKNIRKASLSYKKKKGGVIIK